MMMSAATTTTTSYTSQAKAKGKAEEDENRRLIDSRCLNPQSYHHWMVAELLSCNAILP
jgi:hypothetical protein